MPQVVSRSLKLGSLALSSGLLLTVATAARADEEQAAPQPPLPTVVVTAPGEVESAVTQAPTLAPLTVTQPTSVISQHFIENNSSLSSSYDDIIKIAPSVYAVSPNGPGLMENQILSIRGFTDGQFNVTFDGIPWGDSNDFTHHTTSYFMDHDLGGVSVDRGPGTAATIGNATFGGTVAINSKAPGADTTITPYVGYGSFNTQSVGAQVDTGPVSKYGGAAAFIDAESLSSDGYLQNAGQQRKNVFTKIAAPAGDNTVVTFVAMYNQVHQFVSLGATAQQIAQFGPNYALSRDPTNQNYYGYNYDQIHTDFEYVGVVSRLGGGWTVDNKTYTYAYYHNGFNGEDPNGSLPNGTSYGPNDVPGQELVNNYRSWGDTFKARDDLFFGDIQTGLWLDRQNNLRSLTEADFTLGGAVNPAGNPGSPIPGVDRLLHQTLTTLQPFVQVDWNVLPNLVLSPGVRYDHFERSVDSQVNVETVVAQSYTTDFSSTLPSLVAHYQLASDWAAYAQAAKGFLAPNENFFNSADPHSTNLSPQQSWNYQLGTSWQTKAVSLSADVYYIDFKNLIGSETIDNNTIFFNQGGVTYKGFEAEATVYMGLGFSLYANGSVNSAKNKQTGLWAQDAPDGTATFGAIYNLQGWYGSLLDKWVGKSYGDAAQTVPIGAFSTLDGALGYTVPANSGWFSKASLRLSFNNLLDSHKIIGLAGNTNDAAGTNLYWTLPGRSVFANLSVPF
jgi:iron complex outermembrane recepter protein